MVQQEILFRELKNGKIFPQYLLMGEEEGSKGEFITMLQRQLFKDDNEKALNFTLYHGDEAETEQIIENLTTFSFFSPKKLIVVKKFDRLMSMKLLSDYLAAPSEGSVIILLTEKKSVPQNVTRAVEKHGRVCIVWPMFQNEGEKWIDSQLEAYGIQAKPDVISYLVEVTGTNKNELRSQLECIVNYVAEGEVLSLDTVKSIVAALNTYSVFDLCNALLVKPSVQIIKIFRYLVNNGEDLVKIIYFINRELGKILRAYAMKQSGYGFSQIERDMGFRKKESMRIRSIVDRIDIGLLTRLYTGASSLDQTIKSSSKDTSTVAFERFLLTLGSG